jgi:hypothetical protein
MGDIINYLLYAISFLLGLFLVIITFIIYSVKSINAEKSKIIEKFIENEEKEEEEYKESEENIIDVPIFPKKNYVHMFINTYEYMNYIENDSLKWYNHMIEIKDIKSTDYNESTYFNYNNPINLIKDKVYNYVKGANIKGIEMTGPSSIYFANNDKTFELTEFTFIFMTKFNSFNINKDYTLLEIICNSIPIVDDVNGNKYKPSAIFLNIRFDEENAMFYINIGDTNYYVAKIHKSILINDDITLISLAVNKNIISLTINSKTYDIKNNNIDNITFGSNPIKINKQGDLDILLYSFIYYKVFLNSTDILLYKKYNNYYITGVNTIVKDNELLRNKIIDDDKILLNKNKMLSNVNDILVNSANTDVNISTIDEINIEELGDNIPSNL